MLDYREAIDAIKSNYPPSRYSILREALDLSFEALEKQIPMKPKLTTSTKRCRRCNKQLSGIGNMHPTRNYCMNCGQAIDWSEE